VYHLIDRPEGQPAQSTSATAVRPETLREDAELHAWAARELEANRWQLDEVRAEAAATASVALSREVEIELLRAQTEELIQQLAGAPPDPSDRRGR
jgi:hypothetical protein